MRRCKAFPTTTTTTKNKSYLNVIVGVKIAKQCLASFRGKCMNKHEGLTLYKG